MCLFDVYFLGHLGTGNKDKLGRVKDYLDLFQYSDKFGMLFYLEGLYQIVSQGY